jgi:ribonuclease D
VKFTIKHQEIAMQQLFINTHEDLVSFCNQISGSQWLAIDTEFLREKTYYPVFCLLQVSNGEIAACIDPIAIDDLTPVRDILLDQQVLKVLHAAHQDLEIFYHLWQQVPSPVFDTQLAAAITGYGDQMGYGRLVEQMLNVRLEKDQARTDWSKRPLDQEQQQYALNDVIYLAEIYQRLTQRIAELGREDWLKAEYDTFTDPATFRPDPVTAWTRVKGRQTLKGVQYAVLQKLADWREQRAIDSDRPRRWILKDEVVIDLAKRMPRNSGQLKRIRGLEDKTIERHGQLLLDLIQQGRDTPEANWPSDDKNWNRLSNQQEALTDLLQCCLRLLADQHDITAAAIATRKDLEKLVLGEADTALQQGWRKHIAGKHLQEVINGRLLPCWQTDGTLLLCPAHS